MCSISKDFAMIQETILYNNSPLYPTVSDAILQSNFFNCTDKSNNWGKNHINRKIVARNKWPISVRSLNSIKSISECKAKLESKCSTTIIKISL